MLKKSRKKGVMSLLAIAMVLCALIVPAAPAVAAGINVSISPYLYTASAGETFDVYVYLDIDQDSMGFQCDLSWDPDLITVNSVSDGGFFGSGNFFTAPDLGTPGFADDAAIVNTDGTPDQGAGNVFVVSCTASSTLTGVTVLHLSDVKISDDVGDPMTFDAIDDGGVQVGSPSAISIDLSAIGLGGNVFTPETGYSVSAGLIEEDGYLMSQQSAMGALVAYVQDASSSLTSADITITENSYGLYLYHLGTTTTDDNSWMYYVNGSSPWDGAADYTLSDGDNLVFGNYLLNLYTMTVSVSSTAINEGDPITLTVEYTDGTGTTTPVQNADVYVSTEAYGSGNVTPLSPPQTDVNGELTIASWTGTGDRYPYAEHTTYGSTVYNYPPVVFTCSVVFDAEDGTILEGNTEAKITITIPDDVTGWVLVQGADNTQNGNLNIKCNLPWECIVVDNEAPDAGQMTEWDSSVYGTLSLETAMSVVNDTTPVTVAALSDTEQQISSGDETGQSGDAGEDFSITFHQEVTYGDEVLESPDIYRIVVTFGATMLPY